MKTHIEFTVHGADEAALHTEALRMLTEFRGEPVDEATRYTINVEPYVVVETGAGDRMIHGWTGRVYADLT